MKNYINLSNNKLFMLKFFKNYAKSRKIRRQIDKYQAKTELLKYKNALQNNKIRAKTTQLSGVQKQIQASEDLKQYVASTNQDEMIIKILNNETVQQLLKSVAFKLMGTGKISTDDDELITIYRKLPPDIKNTVKNLAMDYVVTPNSTKFGKKN